jgi:hypothetical protein
MFHRAPSTDSHYTYGDFESFAFAANRLNRPGRLRRPRALESHDVRKDEWGFFIEALAHEALRHASLDEGEPQPRLTSSVLDLLRAWQHAYFGPRAVQVFVSRNGERVYDHAFGVSRHRAALWMPDERRIHTHTASYRDAHSDKDSTESESLEAYADARFPARKRAARRDRRWQRARERRTARQADLEGEWDVHFAYTEPTVFRAGFRPRRYGERVSFERPEY